MITFRNDSAETVPAFGVMRVTDVELGDYGGELYVVGKPAKANWQDMLLVNGGRAVASGDFGEGRHAWEPGGVAVETGTPAAGEDWGIPDDGWKLVAAGGSHYYQKFAIGGMPGNVAIAVLAPNHAYKCKTDASHAKSATGTLSIWTGTKGSESDSTVNLTGIYNSFATLSSGKWCIADWTNGALELVAGEC